MPKLPESGWLSQATTEDKGGADPPAPQLLFLLLLLLLLLQLQTHPGSSLHCQAHPTPVSLSSSRETPDTQKSHCHPGHFPLPLPLDRHQQDGASYRVLLRLPCFHPPRLPLGALWRPFFSGLAMKGAPGWPPM